MSSEPSPEPFASPGLTALDRPDRTAQLTGRLFVRQPLQVAEDHGRSVVFGQQADLFEDFPSQFRTFLCTGEMAIALGRPPLGQPLFPESTLVPRGSIAGRNPQRDA